MKRRLTQLLVACLLVALPLYALNATLAEMLGARHSHASTPSGLAGMPALSAGDAMAGWVDFRRVASSHSTGPHVRDHGHDHADLARHHHDRGDMSVLALDAGAGDGAATDGAGSHAGGNVLASTGVVALVLPRLGASTWPAPPPAAVERWMPDKMERPPRA